MDSHAVGSADLNKSLPSGSSMEQFVREQKALILKYGFTIAQVSQALAIIYTEAEAKRQKELFGKAGK